MINNNLDDIKIIEKVYILEEGWITGKWIKIISSTHGLFDKCDYNCNLNTTLKLDHAVQLHNSNEIKTQYKTIRYINAIYVIKDTKCNRTQKKKQKESKINEPEFFYKANKQNVHKELIFKINQHNRPQIWSILPLIIYVSQSIARAGMFN